MNPFRNKTPARRLNRKECEHYRAYKSTLQEDFNRRCGYCDDADRFRIRSYTIDHFVPQNPKDFSHNIKSNYYYNLIYSCGFCNLAKSNKWATKNENIHNDGKIGFIDPTSEDYTLFFRRNYYGLIESNGVNDTLAAYIIEELKLWYPIHSIIWRLEKLHILKIKVAEAIQSVFDENLRKDLKDIHYELLLEQDTLINNLFAENE